MVCYITFNVLYEDVQVVSDEWLSNTHTITLASLLGLEEYSPFTRKKG
jgi:hypothetical protein